MRRLALPPSLALLLAACGPPAGDGGLDEVEVTGSESESEADEADDADEGTGSSTAGDEDTGTGTSTDTSGSTGNEGADTSTDSGTSGCPADGCLDLPEQTTGNVGCDGQDGCNVVDLLFVIDNSGTMGEEQVNLAAHFPAFVDALTSLPDPDVHIMVTSTDLSHPNCVPFEPDGYDPLAGAPQTVACVDRLDDFTGLGADPPSFPEACTDGCPAAVAPSDPFIAFSGDLEGGLGASNVPGDDVAGALGCIGPQGINGCGYESPLEAMLQALNPSASWNTGDNPFLREGAALGVIIVSDEADCSIEAPQGYAYFTDPDLDTYWEVNPDTGTKTNATSATCWNAGVDCGMPDANGVYADCVTVDNDVLFPKTRYLDYLDQLENLEGKPVFMIGLLGVPPVTEHAADPPFEPTAGGVFDLVYRQWRDGTYPVGDILPGDDDDAASKEYQFGIGPGCTGSDGMGGFTGQAIPPVRMREVCEALGTVDSPRCCIESICDADFSGAVGCLSGLLAPTP